MLTLDVFLQLGEIPSLTVDGLGALLAPEIGHVTWRRGGGLLAAGEAGVIVLD